MPATYKRKIGSRNYHDYDDENIEMDVKAVEGGLSLRQAAEKFGIPKSTIQNKRLGVHKKRPGNYHIN